MAGYKLVTFKTGAGPKAGVVIDDKVHEVAALTGKAGYATMMDVLADWDNALKAIDGAQANASGGLPLAEVTLLAPVQHPSAIFCAGANYADHVANMAKQQGRAPEPDPHTMGLKPWHFIKTANALSDPNATVKLPSFAKKIDWEIELTAVIGRRAKDVSVGDALNYVAGYTIGNDLSARDAGPRAGMPAASPFSHDWVAHKNFEGACPLGPWIVPARDIPDPQKLGLKLWVNGELKQNSNTSNMIFNLAEQIAQVSARTGLRPGDMIMTGTPSGVGHERGEYLKAGDTVKLWIEGIGELTNTMG